MIRVRLLSEIEYTQMWHQQACRDYQESQFYDLLRQKGEFTDPESLSLLRYLHGEEAVAGKWYRRITQAGKPCLPAISPEAKYGLVVIENSLKGVYTSLEDAFTDFEVEARMEHAVSGDHKNPLVWDALASLEMDVLLTFRKKDFSFAWDIPLEQEFILENYPVEGSPVPAHVVPEYLQKPELRNGEWYIHNFFYDLRYHWTKEPEELLEVIRQETADQPPLARGVFSMTDFDEMCLCRNGDSLPERLREERDEAEALGIPYEPREEFRRVLNHMDFLPPEGESRRFLYLLIEKDADGAFRLRNEISVKYPSYQEMMTDAIAFSKQEKEILMLAVDVDEVMDRAADIRKALCAFRLTGDIVETFGPVEGLKEFAKTLQEALDSGRCSISTGKPEEV